MERVEHALGEVGVGGQADWWADDGEVVGVCAGLEVRAFGVGGFDGCGFVLAEGALGVCKEAPAVVAGGLVGRGETFESLGVGAGRTGDEDDDGDDGCWEQDGCGGEKDGLGPAWHVVRIHDGRRRPTRVCLG